jgi:hypothetical protein
VPTTPPQHTRAIRTAPPTTTDITRQRTQATPRARVRSAPRPRTARRTATIRRRAATTATATTGTLARARSASSRALQSTNTTHTAMAAPATDAGELRSLEFNSTCDDSAVDIFQCGLLFFLLNQLKKGCMCISQFIFFPIFPFFFFSSSFFLSQVSLFTPHPLRRRLLSESLKWRYFYFYSISSLFISALP